MLIKKTSFFIGNEGGKGGKGGGGVFELSVT